MEREKGEEKKHWKRSAESVHIYKWEFHEHTKTNLVSYFFELER